MHKGRTYPFHPTFWATQCFFWPGYVPWKMTLRHNESTIYPWSLMGPSLMQVSLEGQTVPDATAIFWEWPLTSPAAADDFRVSVEMVAFDTRFYATWKAVLRQSGITKGTAWFFQPFPCYSCAVPGSPWWDIYDPLSTPHGPNLQLDPSTYAEGGTPWPPSDK